MPDQKRVSTVKRLYPLLYFACHRTHDRPDDLTERDLRILHHVGAGSDVIASGLARHLGLSRSTISEALSRLEEKELIRRSEDGARRKRIELTSSGKGAIESDDGLDGSSIAAILDQLDDSEQRRVIEGLELIAHAIERRRS